MKFNKYDKVKIKRTDLKGIIDTVTPNGRYRVKLDNGYEWVSEFQLEHDDEDNLEIEDSINLDYLS